MLSPCRKRLPPSLAGAAGLTLLLWTASGCSSSPPPAAPRMAADATERPTTGAADGCPQFDAERTGVSADSAVDETSGIAASTVLPGALWAHNDSGDRPRLFAVGRDGTMHGEVFLENSDAIDWEDMSAAPGTLGSPRDLIIGDVGDNLRNRDTLQLYRTAEPTLDQLGGRVPARRFDVRLEGGPADIEALFVDPLDGSVYLVEKSLLGTGVLYQVTLPAQPDPSSPLQATRVGRVPMSLVTAADMPADGSRLVVRNYRSALLWERTKGASITELVQQTPCELALPKEPQGEAIAFADARTLLLLSEQNGQPVYVLTESGAKTLLLE